MLQCGDKNNSDVKDLGKPRSAATLSTQHVLDRSVARLNTSDYGLYAAQIRKAHTDNDRSQKKQRLGKKFGRAAVINAYCKKGIRYKPDSRKGVTSGPLRFRSEMIRRWINSKAGLQIGSPIGQVDFEEFYKRERALFTDADLKNYRADAQQNNVAANNTRTRREWSSTVPAQPLPSELLSPLGFAEHLSQGEIRPLSRAAFFSKERVAAPPLVISKIEAVVS